MDIFNRQRIAELEEKLHQTELERDRYISKAAELTVKLSEVSKFEESIPEGCEKGPWCKACEFCRTVHYTEHYGAYGYNSLETIYTCSKGKSCKNFVQKETEHD